MIRYSFLFVTLVLSWTLAGELWAQEEKKVTFGGAGRFWMENNSIDGDALEGDTTTATREMGGYALFDLGITIRPGKNAEIVAITRFNSELDGFWGAGITTDIRQLTARGLIKEKVRYKVGDLNTAFTPYTMYNFRPELRVNEASIFRNFEEIINYENFYQDSTWRQQGAEFDFALAFPKGIKELSFRGLIAKNRQTDFFFRPDRIFGAAQVGINQGTYGRVDLTYVNLFELAPSAMFSDATSMNQVMSARYDMGMDKENSYLGIVGEAGLSGVMYENQAATETIEDLEDSFLEVGLRGKLKKSGLMGTLSFVDVGPEFRSAAAQTRRLDVTAPSGAFTRIGNEERVRPMSMGDIITDRNVYSRTFGPLLGNFLPYLENVQPFGAATPNRRGITLNVQYDGDSAGIFGAFVNTALLSEIRGQGTTELRDFTKVWGGVTARLHRIYGGKQKLIFTAGASYQSTARDGVEGVDAVDLSTTFVESGLEYEVFSGMDLLGGVKFLSSEGNEFLNQRDAFDATTFYNQYSVDLTETFFAGGFRYNFNETVFLTLQGHFSTIEDNLTQRNSFDLNRVLIVYNMFF